MKCWFQNLNEKKKRLFHFRGNVSNDSRRKYLSYEICSGLDFRFTINHGSNGSGNETTVTFGLVFFTLYLTIPLPKSLFFQEKCIATWRNNEVFYLIDPRVYGFYWYNWTFVWQFHAKANESSSKDPKWMRFSFDLLDFVFGKTEIVRNELLTSENVRFKLGDKEFTINRIMWERMRRIRRNIPMSLYTDEWIRMDIAIDNPPTRSGKGENSWDCGDDATYGLSTSWEHLKPNWGNAEECRKLAVEDYVTGVFEDAKRYGTSSGENGFKLSDVYQYIGTPKNTDGPSNANQERAK